MSFQGVVAVAHVVYLGDVKDAGFKIFFLKNSAGTVVCTIHQPSSETGGGLVIRNGGAET